MKTKLTLSLDGEIIIRAREYAENNNSSISKLVSDYFNSLFSRPKQSSSEFVKTPILSEITGILSNKKYDDKKIKNFYKKHLEEKYL
jgi:flagellar hook-associated protein FlgK